MGVKKFKKTMTSVLEMPEEIILDVMRLTLVGNGNLVIENHKGICSYAEDKIVFRNNHGDVQIEGKHLVLTQLQSDELHIEGMIEKILLPQQER